VLDLYAGSGSIGIEALSRSADWADFVEARADACAVIRHNLQHTKFADRAAVHQGSVTAFLRRQPAEPYDFVVLDPPYADTDIVATLDQVGQSACVAPGTIVVLGHWPRLIPPPALPPLQQLVQRCHGNSCYAIYEVLAGPVDPASDEE
jgi:16S rRNA (guanine966-N2)-methyltransferase